MYRTTMPRGHDQESALRAYAEFLRDTPRFEAALVRVVTEWPISCEQFLSNESLNRVAWLGQASMCIATKIPRRFRAGFMLLTNDEQAIANATAQRTLDAWLQGQLFAMCNKDSVLDTSPDGGWQEKIGRYVVAWERCGYRKGIPDHVPDQLMAETLAPSYRGIAQAILKNDHPLQSLGFTPRKSPWYMAAKRVEFEQRKSDS